MKVIFAIAECFEYYSCSLFCVVIAFAEIFESCVQSWLLGSACVDTWLMVGTIGCYVGFLRFRIRLSLGTVRLAAPRVGGRIRLFWQK